MVRPKCEKKMGSCPKYTEFKPKGSNSSSGFVELTREEFEALRLKNLESMCQTSGAKNMGISQSTFQRILSSAYKKVSTALVQGKIIKLNKK